MTEETGQHSLALNPTATEHGVRNYLSQSSERRQGTSLCLSGGGYRAALFHLGAFRRLNELGLLARIDTFSSVSGGSVAAAVLAEHLARLPEGQKSGPDGMIPGFEEGVAGPIRELSGTNIRTRAALSRFKPRNWGKGNVAIEALADEYVQSITDRAITELPSHPRFLFCATDLSFRQQWTVDAGRNKVGSNAVGYVCPVPDRWSVARAVAASSCFPVIFGPAGLALNPDDYMDGQYQGADRPELLKHMALSDGGVYDNLAVEPVWRDHAVVLVSDAGPSYRPNPDFGPVWRILRYIVTLIEQTTEVRKRWLIASFIRKELDGAYWGMGSMPTNYEPDPDIPVYPDDLIREYISQIRIEFDEFSDAEMAIIENHGYLMTEIAIKRHGMTWALNPEAALVPPWPQWLDPDRAARALANSHKHTILGRGRWW